MGELVIYDFLTLGLVGGVYGLIPLIMPDTLQFGVRIPSVHTDSSSIAKTRRLYYGVWIAILFVLIAGLIVVRILVQDIWTDSLTPLWLCLASVVLNYGNYYLARRRLLSAKVTERWYDGYTEGLVADTQVHQRMRVPSLVWGIPDGLITLAGILLPAVKYNSLPAQVAVHFSSFGVADKWWHETTINTGLAALFISIPRIPPFLFPNALASGSRSILGILFPG